MLGNMLYIKEFIFSLQPNCVVINCEHNHGVAKPLNEV